MVPFWIFPNSKKVETCQTNDSSNQSWKLNADNTCLGNFEIGGIVVLDKCFAELVIVISNNICMLMSDLTHRSLACKAHLNMYIENTLYKIHYH